MSSYRPQRPSQHRGGGGAGGRDSYHPRDDARRRPHRPQPSSYNDYYNTRSSHHPPPPGFDSFRPPQGDFTFRAEKPPGIQDVRYDGRDSTAGAGSHRRDRDRDRKNNRPDNGRRGGERDGGGKGRPYPGYQPMPYRRLAADRPILNTTVDSNKELSFKESASGVTYRALGDLSDSDEAEMDISADEQEDGSAKASAHGSKKRRLAAGDASGNSVPKWSNPDPYTAAPPPDISQQKKKDVVHLIRKARVQPTAGPKPAVPQESADFIPCNLNDSDDEDFVALPPDNSRRGGQLDASLPSRTPHTQSLPAAPTSNLGQKTHGKSSAVDHQGRPLSLPSRPPPPADLGSRKRTHDDEIKVPEHAKLKKHTTKMSPGHILPEWLPVSGKSSCPWVTTDHSGHHSVAVWLHKELVDFYEYVKPRDFEEKLRQSLVDELQKQVRDTWKDASVYAFGSFKSGLYLPTGDMDLVVCSDKFMGSSIAQYNPRKHVFNFARFVERRGLAHRHHVERIHKARVPLVKYVDARTGLKVDISFENLTGIAAIRTFLAWRLEFPAMPILVTVIKHFLAMRGLNEPANGGIGGFSVICLVVSMLQLMPEVQSRSMIPEQHLGQLLLSFFDLYGNKFQYRKMAISLRPPRYVPKNQVQTFAYKTRDRFSIIDPNNPENDIAGGSSNSSMVQFAFSQASAQLRERIAFLARSPVNAPFSSVLEPIFAGNYTTFDEQRQHMQALWARSDFGRR